MKHLTFTIILLSLFDACKTPETKPLTVGESMAQIIDDALKPTNIGYAFQIKQGDAIIGQTVGGSRSKTVDVEGEQPMTIDTRVATGSNTKTVTAIAFLKLASQKGIKTTDKIAPYLPKSWKLGKNVDKITFANLLTHSSGLRGLGVINCQNIFDWDAQTDNYEYIRKVIEQGVEPANYGTFCYYNPNMCLFRIMIAKVLGYQFTGDAILDDYQTEDMFLKYLQTELFEPMGIKNVSATKPEKELFAYSYEYPNKNIKGVATFYRKAPGSGGLYLSAAEEIKFIHAVLSAKDGQVLAKNYSDSLLNNNFASFSRTNTYYHDGINWIQNCSQGVCVSQGSISGWLVLPNNITCILMTNAVTADKNFVLNQDLNVFLENAYIKAQLSAKK